MDQTTSKDGTTIAFDRVGQGQPLILALGAFNDRTTGAPLAAWLAPHFSVFSYDRRGRGKSGDRPPYALEREVEDLAAVLTAADGSATVFGYSSETVLALHAAAHDLPITKLALYELPPARPPEHPMELAALIAAGRRGDAVEYFQRQVVGIPEAIVAQFRHAPFRPALEAMAHTTVYDATLVAYGTSLAALSAKLLTPTLVVAGEQSPPIMRETAEQLAKMLPNARALTLPDATHDINPALLSGALSEFLSHGSASSKATSSSQKS